MSRKKGATLIECGNCHARGQAIEWQPGFGWVCATCESGIWGPNQKPQIDKSAVASSAQFDLGALWDDAA